jgi:large subunit ribosomal protein L10e
MIKMKTSTITKKNQMSYGRKEYMGGIPGSKIVRFTMGNTSKEFSHRVKMVTIKSGQILHNAFEAGRIAAMRHLERRLERKNFMLKIIPYPHQVIREHKRVNVAQADRFQEGMKKAYGKPAAVAARVKNRDVIFIAEVEQKDIPEAKKALEKASHKMPLPMKILVEQVNNQNS